MDVERLAYGIEEAAKATGLGRTTLFAHIADGNLKASKIGGRTMILVENLRDFLSKDQPETKAYNSNSKGE